MTRVALAIVAKDEAAVIGRCILSAAPIVDRVLLLDTGSTDDTVDEAERACADAGLHLTVERRPWRGYGDSQSELLALARESGADYTLQLDADEAAVFEPGWCWPSSSPDGFRVCRLLAGDWEVWGIKVFSNRAPWRYEGERHSRPRLTDAAQVQRLEGFELRNLRDGANGRVTWQQQRQRYADDAVRFAAACARDPNDTRAAYYLAQSYHDAGMKAEALEAYERRAAMTGGFDEERYLAALQAARYRRRLRHEPSAVDAAYLQAVTVRPGRHEARVEYARWLNDRGFPRRAFEFAAAATVLPPSGDLFLVERNAQTWKPWVELARALEGLRQQGEAVNAWRKAMSFPTMPAPDRAYAQQRIRLHREDPRSASEARPAGA